MIDPELAAFHASIRTAKTCEDVFGSLPGDSAMQMIAARTLYRKFATIVHEDRHAGQTDALAIAHEAFSLLSAFWREARDKVAKGTYGTKVVPKVSAVIASQTHRYQIDDVIAAGDLANVYAGVDEAGQRVIVKLSRVSLVNDLLAHEAMVLADLAKGFNASRRVDFPRWFLPNLREAFRVKDVATKAVRNVNVFEERRLEQVVTLNDLVANFPQGIDSRHFVWIFKRLLSVLGYAHGRGWVHGAVLPTHVLVRPADHSVLLVDWSYACQRGDRVLALSPGYRAYCAPEIITKAKAGAATDLYMAAKCMEFVLGGEHAENVPAPFLAVLDACLIPSPHRRSNDALVVYDALDKAAKAVYGPATFVELVLT